MRKISLWFYTGDMTMGTIARPPSERFWNQVSKTSECWEWTSAALKNGYGSITIQGPAKTGKSIRQLAHRFSWELHFGPIPAGMLVCHKCDNRKCVRPDHLFLGTHADNGADMVAKGRSANRSGSKNTRAKLTEEAVKAIRAEFNGSHGQVLALARRFGVVHAVISNILSRKSWSHV